MAKKRRLRRLPIPSGPPPLSVAAALQESHTFAARFASLIAPQPRILEVQRFFQAFDTLPPGVSPRTLVRILFPGGRNPRELIDAYVEFYLSTQDLRSLQRLERMSRPYPSIAASVGREIRARERRLSILRPRVERARLLGKVKRPWPSTALPPKDPRDWTTLTQWPWLGDRTAELAEYLAKVLPRQRHWKQPRASGRYGNEVRALAARLVTAVYAPFFPGRLKRFTVTPDYVRGVTQERHPTR